MPQWKENRLTIFRPDLRKNLELVFFFLIKAPHNLKILHVLIIQFQDTKLIVQCPHGKASLSRTATDSTMKGQQGALLFCLGGHQVFKSMHPTKFLGCNSETLLCPIPAGGRGPAGLQSARSRLGQLARVRL